MPSSDNDRRIQLGTGIGLALVIVGAVIYGRIRPVEVPLNAPLCERAVVCAQPEVSEGAFREALLLLVDHDVQFDVDVPPCTDANVVVYVDPTLDQRASVDDVDMLMEQVRRTYTGRCVDRSDVAVFDPGGVLGIVHGVLHGIGYDHPRFAPTGHVLNLHRPSLHDWRGIP